MKGHKAVLFTEQNEHFAYPFFLSQKKFVKQDVVVSEKISLNSFSLQC